MSLRRGIDRPGIMSLMRDAVIRLTGLPADSVFFSEHAVDTAAPPRPCVSMTLLPYETQQRPGTRREMGGQEMWRLGITSAANGTYAIDIDGVRYSFVAVAQTETQIRAGLLAAINLGAHPNFVATGPATISIDVTSQTLGYRLRVENPSAGVSVTQLRGNMLRLVSAPVNTLLEIECVGSNPTPMSVGPTGVDIAERLRMALLDQDDTRALRDAEHNIVTTRVTDRRQIVGGREETIGVIDAVIATDSLHITTFSDARSATIVFQETP